MNNRLKEGRLKKFKYDLEYYIRIFGKKKVKKAFSINEKRYIEQVYIINLDRKPDRWKSIKKELNRIAIGNNQRLSNISKRFSAIDAKYYKGGENKNILPYYFLSDQFKVEPYENYEILDKDSDYKIDMTKQEIAITLSHIGVWKKMVEDNVEYALILEDDVFFTKNFSTKIDEIWSYISKRNFDMLFLSFDYVKGTDLSLINENEIVHKPNAGIWQASGYILSKEGVKKLLGSLPVYGPVDLWFNLQFDYLNILMPDFPIIKQRIDIESTNSYSIMPILTKIGLYSEETPLIMKERKNLPFILAYGDENTGLTALSEALAMVGYTCCTDLVSIPNIELIINKKSKTKFNAYINTGDFDIIFIKKMRKKYSDLKIIYTSKEYEHSMSRYGIESLFIQKDEKNKWRLLSDFLKIDYPVFEYPNLKDLGKREYEVLDVPTFKTVNYVWDELPWIYKDKEWNGFKILKSYKKPKEYLKFDEKNDWDFDKISFRKDTFPNNLALFSPKNIMISENNIITLKLQIEKSSVRDYTSSAIVTKEKLSFGKFSVKIKPSGVSGVITGVFLHRNSPHQEIDIEFLGNNHYGFLINVFYNPGIEGTKLEYGYRGTPTWIPLDFDITLDFHQYGIDWTENYISWFVDGRELYRRNVWNPTPIPNLPMEFNVNIWNTKSIELAGHLNVNELPTESVIKSLKIKTYEDE